MTRRSLRLEGLETREVPAAVGALDPSFGTAGIVTTTFGAVDAAAAVAVQADGKIVVAGSTSGGNDFAIARYNPDGSLDTTFAGDGTATVDFGFVADDEQATALAVQDDGKIVVVGTATFAGDQDFVVARLTADGTLDPSFSVDGRARFDFAGGGADSDQAYGVAIQGTGAGRTVVVVGTTEQSGEATNFGVVRFTDAGTVASSGDFALGGADQVRGVTIDSAMRIVVVGHTDFGPGVIPGNLAVLRLEPDGVTPDTDFDADGELVVDIGGGNDEAAGVAIDSDDRIVVAGTVVGAGSNFVLTRRNADGSPDPSFSGDGEAVFNLGGVDTARGVAVLPDGRIVVVGTTTAGAAPDDFAVLRLTAAGDPDTSFSADGRVFVDAGGDDEAAGVAIDRNGRVVVAGRTSVLNNFAVARLIGGVEKGETVAAGGAAGAAAAVFEPDAAGTLPATSAAVAAFGASSANVRTAVADVNGDGFDDTILATGPGVPLRVAVVSGTDDATLLVAPFAPFAGSEDFAGGGFVSAGDFDLDGRAEFVVTPDVSGGPRVTVFTRGADGTPVVRANFFGIDDPAFRGGARTAVGDVDGDGIPDLTVTAGFGGGPRAALFDGATVLGGTPTRLVNDFFAFGGSDSANLRNGAFVAAGDVDGDGFADLVFGGGPGGAPRVLALGGALLAAGNVGGAQAAPVLNFFVAGNDADRGGVRVAVADLDGDHRADVLAASGENRPAALRAYLGANVSGSGEPAAFQDVSLFGGLTLAGGVFVG
ncbi:MAG: hypothetical protein U0804_01705 [Gemmataceae bacterium]